MKAVSLVICYEEQYFKFGPFSDNITIPKKGSKMIVDMEANHSFSISSASSSVFLYLLLTTSNHLLHKRCLQALSGTLSGTLRDSTHVGIATGVDAVLPPCG